jgi:tetratricopeptide (TPR) repeat protein
MERLYADRLVEQVEKLAYHAFRGELWDEAAAYSRRSGIKAAGRSAYQEAVASFQQALSALARLPETQQTLEQAVDIRFELRNALWPLGQLRRGLDHLHEAQPLAERLGDRRRLARLWAHTSSAHWLIGDHRRALDAGRRALEIATDLDDFRIQVDARHFLGTTLHSLGDYDRSKEFLTGNMIALTGEWLARRFGLFYAVNARTWLVWGLAPRGQFEAAEGMAEEGLRIAEAGGYPADLTAASWSLGYAKLQRGELSQAVSFLRRCHGIAQEASVTVWLAPIGGALGYASVLSGALDQGIRLLEGVVAPGAAENQIGMSEWQVYLADAYLRAARLGEAVETAERAVTLARQRDERGAEALALRVLAEVAGTRDLAGRAEELYGEGLTLAGELGMRPLLAHSHLGLSKLHRRTGKPQQAQEHLTTAKKMYREMDMGFWLAQVEAELKALA